MFTVESNHWWYVGLHDLIQVLAKIYLGNHPLDILDAGCGTGGLLLSLKDNGHHVEGFDFSDEAIELCRKRGIENLSKADINHWRPEPNSYDLITIMDVLCHDWVIDEIQVLRSAKSGLKKNGLIMLNYPAFRILGRHHDQVVMIRERYTKNMLERILFEAELSPIVMSYRLPHAYCVLLFLRVYEIIRKNSPKDKSDIANIPSDFVNGFLSLLNILENKLIARGYSLPFGSSLFVVAHNQ